MISRAIHYAIERAASPADVTAFALVLATVAEALPPISAGLSIVWLSIRIWDSRPVREWTGRPVYRRERDE